MYQALTVVWNKKYVDNFIKGTIKCLSHKRNLEAMKWFEWNIFTTINHNEEITQAIKKYLPEVKYNILDVSQLRSRTDELHAALDWQIKRCFIEKTKMLLLMPDTLIGDGTIENMVTISNESEKKICIASPHPRVLPSILNEDFVTNQDLVRASFKHLHQSWSHAEIGHPKQNGFSGGVKWQKLEDNLYSVCHRLPTVYFADFTDEDYRYFDSLPGFGHYDWQWPADKLIPQERILYVGSSDAMFFSEITDASDNVPPMPPNFHAGDANEFFKNNVQTHLNNQIRAIFRS